MSRVKALKSWLKEQLRVEPGIKSFAYPDVRRSAGRQNWYNIDEKEVKETWSNLSDPKEGILYTHIKFCQRRCTYCGYATDFGVSVTEQGSYVEAIGKEIELLLPNLGNIKFSAIYFGGGSPTFLQEGDLERVVRLVTSSFPVSSSAEVSIEVYPSRSMLRSKMTLLKGLGINRVSIGVQDFDDGVISSTKRTYSGEEASQIVSEAMQLFDTVNVDLICGLPKQERWPQTLERTLELRPQQVTVQPLSNRHDEIELHKPEYKPMLFGLDQMIEMYNLACSMLTGAGYTRTSRHQFIREGEHRYEQKISESTPRLGIGANSISLVPGLTYKNHEDRNKYQEAIRKGILPIEAGVRITGEEEIRSYLFHSLSADCGKLSLSEKEFSERFGQRIQDKFPEEVQALEEEGLINVNGDRIDLTPRGIYFTSVLQRTFSNPDFMKKKESVYNQDSCS